MMNVVAVESLYSAMCDCQALHPDENDSLSAGITLYLISVYYFYIYYFIIFI